MPDNAIKKPVNRFNLPGYLKASEVDTFEKRLDALGECNIYLFRIRNKQKIIAADKGVKPLTPEGREALAITPATARVRVKNAVGNYGAYAFVNGLCFLDLDLDINNPGHTVVPYEKISDLIEAQDTFTVLTRSGGYQFYFRNPGLSENPHVYYKRILEDGSETLIDAGELRCNNQYVVAPGSYVNPEGPKGYTEDANGVYRVIWDAPIRDFDPKSLPDWLQIAEPAKVREKRKHTKGSLPVEIDVVRKIPLLTDDKIFNRRGISLADLRSGNPHLNLLLSSADEFGRAKSASEADWAAIISLLKYRFTDQQVYDIILTHRTREKLLREDYLPLSISRAKHFVVEDEVIVSEANKPDVPMVSGPGRTVVDSLPDDFPLHQLTQVNGLARVGKSTWGLKQMLKEGCGEYISTTHSIIENGMEMLIELMKERGIDKTCSVVVGKNYSCNDDIRKGHCGGCPKAPKNPTDVDKPGISILKYDELSRTLLLKYRHLTINNVPAEYCPYHVLMHAHQFADFVFAVVFYSTVDDDVRKIEGRGLVVIDEGPTCDHFRTPVAQLATYQTFKIGGMVTPALGEKYEVELYKLREFIKHRLDDEEGGPSMRRMPPIDSALIKIIEKLYLIQDILLKFNLDPTPKRKKWTEDQFKAIDFNNSYNEEFKTSVLSKLEEYCKDAGVRDDNMADIFTIALYPAECPFSWQGSDPSKLFFVSNDDLYRVPEGKKFLVIGAEQTKKFVKRFAEKRGITDVHELYCTGFPFPNNYEFVVMSGPSPEQQQKMKEKEPDVEIDMGREQRRQLNKIYNIHGKYNSIHRSKIPALVITASKDKQQALHSRLKSTGAVITNETIDGVFGHWTKGSLAIYTQNASISRGIDVPFYDLMYFNPGGFATPIQRARIQFLIEKRADAEDPQDMDAEIASLQAEIAAIQSDEITNNVLRSAPVRGDPSILRLKVVIMCQEDYDKIDYRIKEITKATFVTSDMDPKAVFHAISDTQHKVTPTDANLDRPYPHRSKCLPASTCIEPLLSLDAMHGGIANFQDLEISTIDRSAISYEKLVNQIVRLGRLLVPNKLGRFGSLSKSAIINKIIDMNGKHITEDVVEQNIICALTDRILVSKHNEGKTLFSLHPNAIQYLTIGFPSTGPGAPNSYAVLHPVSK